MNSELYVTMSLEALKSDLENQINSLKEESSKINDKGTLSKRDKNRLKNIDKSINALSRRIYVIDIDIDSLKNLPDDRKEEFSLNLANKYGIYLNSKDFESGEVLEIPEGNGMEENDNKKKIINKKSVSIVALLLALGISIGLITSCSRKDNKKPADSDKSYEDTTDLASSDIMNAINNLNKDELYQLREEVNNQLNNDSVSSNSEEDNKLNGDNVSSNSEESNQEVVEEGFVDIFDEEEVSKRANEFLNEINTKNPGNDYSVEEIENIMKWINCGNVNEASQQEALFAVTRVESLMNKENQKEVASPFNISVLFKDGSRGQKLASKIYDYRCKLMASKDEKEYNEYVKEFTILLVNSWKLNGTNNEISAYELETSFMEALIDKYFLNTYAMINNTNVNVEVMGVEFNLDEVADEINQANCPAVVTADNGETFTTYVNKFSSDMIGAVTEATLVKENSNSLSLVK